MAEIVGHCIVEAQRGQVRVLPLWRGPFSSKRVHTEMRTSPMGDAAPFSSTADAFATAPISRQISASALGTLFYTRQKTVLSRW